MSQQRLNVKSQPLVLADGDTRRSHGGCVDRRATLVHARSRLLENESEEEEEEGEEVVKRKLLRRHEPRCRNCTLTAPVPTRESLPENGGRRERCRASTDERAQPHAPQCHGEVARNAQRPRECSTSAVPTEPTEQARKDDAEQARKESEELASNEAAEHLYTVRFGRCGMR